MAAFEITFKNTSLKSHLPTFIKPKSTFKLRCIVHYNIEEKTSIHFQPLKS